VNKFYNTIETQSQMAVTIPPSAFAAERQWDFFVAGATMWGGEGG